MVGVSTAIILDLRRTRKDGTFPVRLRVTYRRQQKYYLTDYSLTPEEYAKTQTEKPRGNYKELQLTFQAIEQRANDIINKLPEFTFEIFEKNYLNVSVKNDVFGAFKNQIERLGKEGRAGTADAYKCTLNSLLAYHKKKLLSYSVITPDYLRDYENWMVKSGKSLTTVGIYLRNLRVLFNEAIANGEISQVSYPFGKRKYQIPAGRNVKKALVLTDIEKLFNYEPKTDSEARSRDLWIFSYLCNGINIKDIARLKYSNLDKIKISFIRAKTERTTRQNRKTIIAMRTPEVDSIIERWGNKPAYPDSYVFPLLTKGLTPEKELATVRQATKTINMYIKRIAVAVGVEINISTYTARHSYATVLKRSGAPMEFISEALGHSDLRTTESYLDSFEDDVKKQYASQLTAFKTK